MRLDGASLALANTVLHEETAGYVDGIRGLTIDSNTSQLTAIDGASG